MTSNITLFTSYYQSPDNDRQHEIDLCLRNNVDLEEINHIYLFIDDDAVPPVESNKVTIIRLPHRPTYADWIETILNTSIKGICLLANSDIYFRDRIFDSFRSRLQ